MKESGDCTESSTATITSVESHQAEGEELEDSVRPQEIAPSGTPRTPMLHDDREGVVPAANYRRATLIDIDEAVDSYDKKEGAANHDDDDSSSEDEDADLKSIQRFKQQAQQKSNGGTGGGSLRRVDSFERFERRSLRLSILGKDQPPPAEEVAKRTVRFRPDQDLERVFALQLPEDEEDGKSWMSQCYMTNADFERNDADMKLTHFRWQNHLNGKIRFDNSEWTLRGLEFMCYPQEQGITERRRLQHQQRVLEESYLQITAQLYQDRPWTRAQHHWETIRQASLENSNRSLTEAQARARRDHVDYCKAWGEPCDSLDHDNEKSLDSTFGIHAGATALLRGKHEQQKQQRQQQKSRANKTDPQQDKKKKKNPLLFWKN
jgi:hypothetical protein